MSELVELVRDNLEGAGLEVERIRLKNGRLKVTVLEDVRLTAKVVLGGSVKKAARKVTENASSYDDAEAMLEEWLQDGIDEAVESAEDLVSEARMSEDIADIATGIIVDTLGDTEEVRETEVETRIAFVIGFDEDKYFEAGLARFE